MSDLIKSVRLSISNMGGSELKAVANNEGMQEMFKQKQALIAEMNTAKRQAADAATADAAVAAAAAPAQRRRAARRPPSAPTLL